MSTFKHHRDNKHRYNIYESHVETIVEKDFYIKSRNILFFIALTVSLFVTTLISFDTYKKQKNNNFKILLLNQNQDKNEITKLEIAQAISNSIIQKIDANNSFGDINNKQLKRIIKNVLEKVKNSPNHTLYTHK